MTHRCLFLYPHPAIYNDLSDLTCCIDTLKRDVALNPDKSETILLGIRRQAPSYPNLAIINVAGCQIPVTDQINIYFGVTLDKNLSIDNHVNSCQHICSLPYPRYPLCL